MWIESLSSQFIKADMIAYFQYISGLLLAKRRICLLISVHCVQHLLKHYNIYLIQLGMQSDAFSSKCLPLRSSSAIMYAQRRYIYNVQV